MNPYVKFQQSKKIAMSFRLVPGSGIAINQVFTLDCVTEMIITIEMRMLMVNDV
jgi:hypothetical protein